MPPPNENSPRRSGNVAMDVLCAGAVAWAVPGLGHALIGCRRHAWAVGGGVGFLWIVGLAIGGLPALDARPAPVGSQAWFFAQAGAGPSVLAERLGASLRRGEAPPRLALGRGREVAALYLAAAGLLNAMAVADAMLRAAGRKDVEKNAAAQGAAKEAA